MNFYCISSFFNIVYDLEIFVEKFKEELKENGVESTPATKYPCAICAEDNVSTVYNIELCSM